jgi:hypothetical protein
MGGTTQTQNTNQTQSQFQNAASNLSQQRSPWDASTPFLQQLLSRLSGTSSSLTPTESSAISGLGSSGGYISQFLPQTTGLASSLLSGNATPDRTGILGGAYDTLKSQLTPTASGQFLDPNTNPFFRQTTNTITDDVQKRLESLYAGSGRDPAGAGSMPYWMGRGVAEGVAPTFANVYEQERGNQLGAANQLFGGGASTAAGLSGLDQTKLGNMLQGLNVAGTGQQIASDPFNTMLAAEAQRRGIPLQTMQMLAQMGVPIAGLGGTTSQAGTQTGSIFGNTQGQTSTSVPFNPLSLAPLAFLPMGGGAGSSLAGSLFGKLFGGGGGGYYGGSPETNPNLRPV